MGEISPFSPLPSYFITWAEHGRIAIVNARGLTHPLVNVERDVHMGSGPELSVAERLDSIFKMYTKPDGSEWSHQEVESGTEGLGKRVTAGAIWKIRNGHTTNPGYLTLRVIARFFGVEPGIFYGDPDEFRRRMHEDHATLRDPDIREIARRADRLDEKGRKAVLDLVRYLTGNGAPEADPDEESDSEE